jgi:predicted Rossmann-fold nucleotide-binding protein
MIDELIRWSAGPGVRGGSSVGLMGLISRAVHNGGGHMLGVAVLPLELIDDTPGELEAVSDMHHSKAEMARQSDAFIALPGNYCSFLLFVVTRLIHCERQRVEEPDLI